MGEQKEQKPMRRICAGLLAHVDAGKTTLSEGMLYAAECMYRGAYRLVKEPELIGKRGGRCEQS